MAFKYNGRWFESSVIHKNVKLKMTKEYFCVLSIDFIFCVLT